MVKHLQNLPSMLAFTYTAFNGRHLEKNPYITEHKKAPTFAIGCDCFALPTYQKEHLYESTEVYRDGRSSGHSLGCGKMDGNGKLIMECLLETKAAIILEFVQGLRGTLSLTFEEGTSAAWLHDLLSHTSATFWSAIRGRQPC